jgi:hypothetical protein
MFLSWTMVLLLPIAQADVVKQDYATEIRPLLERRCFSCHGALQQKGGLRLDTATHLRTGGDSGPSVNLTAGFRSWSEGVGRTWRHGHS